MMALCHFTHNVGGFNGDDFMSFARKPSGVAPTTSANI